MPVLIIKYNIKARIDESEMNGMKIKDKIKENWGWMFRKMDGYIVGANYAITYMRIVLEQRD